MKKNVLIIFMIIISLVTVTRNGVHHSLAYASVDQNEDSFDQQLNKIIEMARIISNHFEYGVGTNISNGLNSVLNNPQGNCAQTAYSMGRYSESLGLSTKLVGIFTDSGTNHLFAETIIEGKRILIDSSNGVVYPHSVIEIIGNIQYLNDMIGIPKDPNSTYLKDYFWSNVSQIKYEDLYKYESPVDAVVIKYSDDFVYPFNSASIVTQYDRKEYAAAEIRKDDNPTYVEIDLKNPYLINRIVIEWYSGRDYATDFTLQGSIDGINFETIYDVNDYNPALTGSERTLIQANSNIRFLKFSSTKYNGQQRLLLRKIKIFSDPFDWNKFIQDKSF